MKYSALFALASGAYTFFSNKKPSILKSENNFQSDVFNFAAARFALPVSNSCFVLALAFKAPTVAVGFLSASMLLGSYTLYKAWDIGEHLGNSIKSSYSP